MAAAATATGFFGRSTADAQSRESQVLTGTATAMSGALATIAAIQVCRGGSAYRVAAAGALAGAALVAGAGLAVITARTPA